MEKHNAHYRKCLLNIIEVFVVSVAEVKINNSTRILESRNVSREKHNGNINGYLLSQLKQKKNHTHYNSRTKLEQEDSLLH